MLYLNIFNKHAKKYSVGEPENIFVGDLKNTWKTGEHLFQVLHTHSIFSISLYFALFRVPEGCICILHCLGFQRVALPGCPIALAFHSPTHQDLSGQRYTRKTIKPKRSWYEIFLLGRLQHDHHDKRTYNVSIWRRGEVALAAASSPLFLKEKIIPNFNSWKERLKSF